VIGQDDLKAKASMQMVVAKMIAHLQSQHVFGLRRAFAFQMARGSDDAFHSSHAKVVVILAHVRSRTENQIYSAKIVTPGC
jgi:hypothetical protein